MCHYSLCLKLCVQCDFDIQASNMVLTCSTSSFVQIIFKSHLWLGVCVQVGGGGGGGGGGTTDKHIQTG